MGRKKRRAKQWEYLAPMVLLAKRDGETCWVCPLSLVYSGEEADAQEGAIGTSDGEPEEDDTDLDESGEDWADEDEYDDGDEDDEGSEKYEEEDAADYDPRLSSAEWVLWDGTEDSGDCLIGWGDILGFLGDLGWELVTASADHRVRSEAGGTEVVSYQLFLKRPRS